MSKKKNNPEYNKPKKEIIPAKENRFNLGINGYMNQLNVNQQIHGVTVEKDSQIHDDTVKSSPQIHDVSVHGDTVHDVPEHDVSVSEKRPLHDVSVKQNEQKHGVTVENNFLSFENRCITLNSEDSYVNILVIYYAEFLPINENAKKLVRFFLSHEYERTVSYSSSEIEFHTGLNRVSLKRSKDELKEKKLIDFNTNPPKSTTFFLEKLFDDYKHYVNTTYQENDKRKPILPIHGEHFRQNERMSNNIFNHSDDKTMKFLEATDFGIDYETHTKYLKYKQALIEASFFLHFKKVIEIGKNSKPNVDMKFYKEIVEYICSEKKYKGLDDSGKSLALFAFISSQNATNTIQGYFLSILRENTLEKASMEQIEAANRTIESLNKIKELKKKELDKKSQEGIEELAKDYFGITFHRNKSRDEECEAIIREIEKTENDSNISVDIIHKLIREKYKW